MKVAVLGATGFTGEKLVEILLSHPKAEVVYLASRTKEKVPYCELLPEFKAKTSLECEPLNLQKASQCVDILFLSLPHTVSMGLVPYLLNKKKKVIDLSADYRLNSVLYKKYYGKPHKDKKNLAKAVYGMPEINKEAIARAQLVANPGCYPTSIILALFPLLAEAVIESKVIADSKSSVTGAGRKAAADYGSVCGDVWAYKPFVHQHMPEMQTVLYKKTKKNVDILFVPHVIRAEPGLYSTIYVWFKKKITVNQINAIYRKHYLRCPFVRVSKDLPKLNKVVGTNFCDIGFALDNRGRRAVIASCIDNLVKGAAGTAVQNMNIMAGFSQTLGLL